MKGKTMAKKSEIVKEKIERIKKKIPQKVKQALLTTAIVGAGVASVTGVSSHIKKEREKENNRVNTEWKKEFADADSVYADSKTAHFYAHKDLKNKDKAQLEDYLQKLKNEKRKRMSVLLGWALEDGEAEEAEELFNNGAKVGIYFMEKISKDPSCIKVGDSYEMMKRLFEQYEKSGGCDTFFHDGFTGYDWSRIKQNLQEYIAKSGDQRYQEFVDFARKEIQKAKDEGRSFYLKETQEVNVNYFEKYYTLHPLFNGYELSISDEIEVLDVEIRKTEFQLESGREYEIEMTSKDSKKILSASKGIQKSYVELLKLKGNAKD